MAQVDSIKVGNTSYYTAANAASTNTFTTSDDTDSNVTSSTSWYTVDKLESTDTNQTILEKLSKMFRNIRLSYKLLDTKAASSHNHDTSNITSGTLVTTRGGTGQSLSSAPSIITNLASTSGANPLTASPRPGVTGTISVNNLPVYSSHINSNSYIPTSALIYSMNTTIENLRSQLGV